MRLRDERFLSFIIAIPTRSKSRIRRFQIHKNWVRTSVLGCCSILLFIPFGLFGLAQHSRHLSIEHENARLKAERDRQREELVNLIARVQRVEATSQELAERYDLRLPDWSNSKPGSGGPATPADESKALHELNVRTGRVEKRLFESSNTLMVLAKVPSIWPVSGQLNDDFGLRRDPFGGGIEDHPGLDIKAEVGTPIRAAAAGVVVYANWMTGYGQMVAIDHGNAMITRYGHLSALLVADGQMVKRGDPIGLVGVTGRTTGPHLHYEVRINNVPVDPKAFLPTAPTYK